MFRDLRRKKQQMPIELTHKVLSNGSHGILACHGDDGYPYTVALNYVYTDGKIYFHSAKEGHKIDAIQKNSKVAFTVVGEDTIVSEEYTSYYRSVVAFGRARVVQDEQEWFEAFEILVEKYAKDRPTDEKMRTIKGCNRVLVIAIDIEHITGKQARGLAH